MQSRLARTAWGVAALILAVSAYRQLKASPQYADIPSYRRVDWWVVSADCAQKKHVILAACGPQGELYPMEDVSPTDDRGHALFLDLAAMLKSGPPSRTDSVRLNVLINLAGVLLLTGFLAALGMPWAAWGALAAGSWLFSASVAIAGPDAPASFFGEFVLAALPAIWFSHWDGRWPKTFREKGLCFVSFAALGTAVMLRQAIGLVGVVAVVILLLVKGLSPRSGARRSAAPYIVFLLLAGMTTQFTTAFLALRNRCSPVPPARLIATHGVAHALYQGLGTEPNPWGIVYGDDADSQETVLRINSRAHYGTPDYYREIGKLYLKIVFEHPGTVLEIYSRKVWKTLTLPLKVFGVPYIWFLLLGGICLVREWRSSHPPSAALQTAAAFLLYLALFLSQGVLISPEIRFLYPAKFGVLVFMALLAEHRLARFRRRVPAGRG